MTMSGRNTGKRERNSDFDRAIEDNEATIAATFHDDSVHVHSEPASSDGEKARAFLLVAASLAAQAGIGPGEFAEIAREYAERSAVAEAVRDGVVN